MNLLVLAGLWRDHHGHELHRGLVDRINRRSDAHRERVHAERRTSGVYAAVKSKGPGVEIEPATPGQYSFQDSAQLRKLFQQRLKRKDAIIAEVTIGNLELGMQIEMAITESKPVLCLFKPSVLSIEHRFPLLLSGGKLVTIKPYLDENDPGLDHLLDDFFQTAPAKPAKTLAR